MGTFVEQEPHRGGSGSQASNLVGEAGRIERCVGRDARVVGADPVGGTPSATRDATWS